MASSIRAFANAVARRVGRCDRPALDEAIRATLRALGSHLGGVPPELHDAIPAALRPVIAQGKTHPPLGPAAMYLMISNEIGLRVGMALEIAQTVVTELAARLSGPARRQLRQRLPPAWASFVTNPEPQPEARALTVA